MNAVIINNLAITLLWLSCLTDLSNVIQYPLVIQPNSITELQAESRIGNTNIGHCDYSVTPYENVTIGWSIQPRFGKEFYSITNGDNYNGTVIGKDPVNYIIFPSY